MDEFKAGQEAVISIIINYGIYLSGLLIFVTWLVRTSLGTKALVNSVQRRTNMPVYMPFIPLLICFGGTTIIVGLTERIWPKLPEWQNTLINNLAMCLGTLTALATIIFLVRRHFSRGLKGLGLNVKTIPKDFGIAILNLLSVWPLLLFIVITTTYIGSLFMPDFELQQHYELEKIAEHSQIYLRVLIIITTIVIVPVFEELLFRGLFQTIIRSFIARPWASILLSSLLFTIVHSNASHWPALLALSVCIGYSYEKSGSLFRPIFIHMIFNATSVITVLARTTSL